VWLLYEIQDDANVHQAMRDAKSEHTKHGREKKKSEERERR